MAHSIGHKGAPTQERKGAGYTRRCAQKSRANGDKRGVVAKLKGQSIDEHRVSAKGELVDLSRCQPPAIGVVKVGGRERVGNPAFRDLSHVQQQNPVEIGGHRRQIMMDGHDGFALCLKGLQKPR